MTISISIVIPHYNDNKNLYNLVRSIKKNKEFEVSDEILIIDDKSFQQPKIDLKNVKIHILKNNSGPSTARNIGIKKAKNKIILFLDSDTELQQGSLSYIKKFYRSKNNQNIILNGCCSYNPIKKNFFTYYKALNEYFWFKEMKKITKKQILNTRVGCIRRSILKKKNIYFDEKITNNFVEDYIFSKKLSNYLKNKSENLLIKHDFPSFYKTSKLYFLRSREWCKLLLKNDTNFNEGGGTSKKNALSAMYSFIFFTSLILSTTFNSNFYIICLLSLFLFIDHNFELIKFVSKKEKIIFLVCFTTYHLFLNSIIVLGAIFGIFYFLIDKINLFRT